MNGYVMNTSNTWVHAMKREIGPGGKVELNELYEQYGIKYGLKEGPEFVEWLRNVKLRNRNKWRVIIEDYVDTPPNAKIEEKADEPIKAVDNVAPMVKTKLGVNDIVDMSVRKAREALVKVNDLNLLRYALQEANQLAGKDSLCKVIRKRIKDLQIAR